MPTLSCPCVAIAVLITFIRHYRSPFIRDAARDIIFHIDADIRYAIPATWATLRFISFLRDADIATARSCVVRDAITMLPVLTLSFYVFHCFFFADMI